MTLIRYKLATRDRTTHNGFKLPADGEWFHAADPVSPPTPCSNTVLHHYAHPLLAVLFNPIHGAYADPILFEIEIDEELGTDGLKGWSRAQRIVREIPPPVLTIEQCIAFAIYVAEPYCADPAWNKWAADWMSGEDRSKAAARAAWAAAWAAAARAAKAADAAWAAARAAAEAAWAARAAVAVAADAAARAAWARAAARPDFLAIIQRVIDTEGL